MRVSAVLVVAAVACSTSDPPGASGQLLVVGVQSDELGGLVGSIHWVVKQDGAVVHDETVPTPPGTSTAIVRETNVTGAPGSQIDVMAEALPPGGGAPIIARAAGTRVPASGKKLLRVQLEGRCAVIPSATGPLGVTCAAPLTCIAGACGSPFVNDVDLEDYETGWNLAPPDLCRPAKHGAPDVTIGTGQTDYGTLADGQVLRLEKGPQGGHHVWIAVRMKNLRQSGSTTTITSHIEGDDAPVPPASFVFTFDRDEGAYCKIWGLRYQVDAGEIAAAPADGGLPTLQGYRRFLGKRLAITVEVTDSTGAKASSTRTVQISDQLLCPDGTTTSCQ